MFFLIEKGGFFMWPLLFCSIAALAIVCERMVYFIRNQGPAVKLMESVRRLVHEKKSAEALELCRKTRGPLACIGEVYLSNLHLKKEDREEILHREGSVALEQLENHLNKLASIAHISPLLGLLGTVTGMILAFKQVQALGGQVDIEVLAGGIWEALLTTAVGLSIAIPTMASFNYFEARVDKTQSRMHYFTSVLNELLGFGQVHGHLRVARHSPETEETVDAI
ncbi:MAG: MotA/TolQ/ExbB proton channel family protein [Deltaproteobacteria bacterium]|nr:MotA/TolQ/ExbB proton channel family protein [Deltaproteobacteria bacterium]